MSITKIFQEHELEIKIEFSTSKEGINFDVGKVIFWSFSKENVKIVYMNFNSNHPQLVNEEPPSIIQKRLQLYQKLKRFLAKLKFLIK